MSACLFSGPLAVINVPKLHTLGSKVPRLAHSSTSGLRVCGCRFPATPGSAKLGVVTQFARRAVVETYP